jgi:hypothetical protein
VVVNEFRKSFKVMLLTNIFESLRVTLDSIVKNSAFIAEGDGVLPRIAFTLSNKEAAIDTTAQKVLCFITRDGTMKP